MERKEDFVDEIFYANVDFCDDLAFLHYKLRLELYCLSYKPGVELETFGETFWRPFREKYFIKSLHIFHKYTISLNELLDTFGSDELNLIAFEYILGIIIDEFIKFIDEDLNIATLEKEMRIICGS